MVFLTVFKLLKCLGIPLALTMYHDMFWDISYTISHGNLYHIIHYYLYLYDVINESLSMPCLYLLNIRLV